jgi:hypothetical protein
MGEVGAELGTHEEISLAALEDDCRLLSSLLDETLRMEVGVAGFNKLNKIRCIGVQCSGGVAALSRRWDLWCVVDGGRIAYLPRCGV